MFLLTIIEFVGGALALALVRECVVQRREWSRTRRQARRAGVTSW